MQQMGINLSDKYGICQGGRVNKYPTPDQLWEMTYPDENDKEINSIQFHLNQKEENGN